MFEQEEEQDPWAGGLISNGRREQLEELQRRFEVLAEGDFGFSVEVVLEKRPAAITRAIQRLGQAFAEEQIAMAVGELLPR